MMPDFEIKVDLSEVYEFMEELGAVPNILHEEVVGAMDASLSVWEQYAVPATPVGATGHARQSIDTMIHGAPPNLRGVILMGVPYGLPLEHGRKRGKWPPRDAIAMWVRRKLDDVPEEQVDRVAFLIQRAIGERGTEGAHMFETAWDKGKRPIMRIWEDVPGRVLGRLA